MNASPVFGSLAALVGVIVLIPLVLWLLKRTPLGGGATRGPMRVVGMLALGPSQRLVTVEVGSGNERRWLVLSVAPSGVTTLHTMAPCADDAAQAATAQSAQATAGSMPVVPASPVIAPAIVPAFAKLFAAQRMFAAGKAARRAATRGADRDEAHRDAA